MKILLASVIALSSITPAIADEYQRGYSASRTCYKSEYREEYVPGTADDPGYIKSWNETIEVPCSGRRTSTGTIHRHTTVEYDNNDCSDAKIAGALLGGGAAAAMSRGDGRWWAIPLGVVVGSHIGCDAAGG